ncbi:MAG: Protein RecA [Parcubacteria group bacterium GW2011_GWB1_45_7]|nr:MAG: Protein RecA [Parcubacteria group bacterium GW2011_GWB1_45_7]
MEKKRTTTSKEAARGEGAKADDLDAVLQALRAKHGEEAIMRLGDPSVGAVEVVSAGPLSLDIALGGGLPKGRIIEIYGPEGSGKTTLALTVAVETQRAGGRVAFIDAEHALDPEYAKRIGLVTKELLLSQPSSGEEALNILESLIRSGAMDLVIVDSVAALTPQAEIDGAMGDQQIGLQARLMSKALRKLTALAAKSGTMIIFINQLREKIGIMFGNPETTPGGRALKFYSSVRIDIRRIAQIKKGENVVGHRTKIKIAKNKVAPPFKVVELDIIYGEGFSYEGDILNLAIKDGVVKKSGTTYSFGEEKLGVGLENARNKLVEDKKLLASIKREVLRVIKEKAKQ